MLKKKTKTGKLPKPHPLEKVQTGFVVVDSKKDPKKKDLKKKQRKQKDEIGHLQGQKKK